MAKGFIDEETYERLIFEEGTYYPMIFTIEKDIGKYLIFMPIKDCNDEIDVGIADSFDEAYKKSQDYLDSYIKKFHKYPKYINPYNIQIDDNEILVMVKYS